MASSKQQASQLKKLLIVGGVLLVIVVVALPSGSSAPTGPKKGMVFGNPSESKKKDSMYTKDDETAKFESVNASMKNGFVPLLTKGQSTKTETGHIPSSFVGGEGTWTYTGNMVVDGVPNALLENSSNGDGVFLRPGQHWKNLRLVSVREDSIVLDGPNGASKTVYFEDKSLSVAASPSSTTLQPLPPATIQGNLPPGANPQPNQPGGRRGRFNQQANADAMVGQIGASNDLGSSLDGSNQTNNTNNTGNNRRIRRNQ